MPKKKIAKMNPCTGPSQKILRLADGVRKHCSGLSPERKQELLDFAELRMKKGIKPTK